MFSRIGDILVAGVRSDGGKHAAAPPEGGPRLEARRNGIERSTILELHVLVAEKRHELVVSEIGENLPIPIERRRLGLP